MLDGQDNRAGKKTGISQHLGRVFPRLTAESSAVREFGSSGVRDVPIPATGIHILRLAAPRCVRLSAAPLVSYYSLLPSPSLPLTPLNLLFSYPKLPFPFPSLSLPFLPLQLQLQLQLPFPFTSLFRRSFVDITYHLPRPTCPFSPGASSSAAWTLMPRLITKTRRTRCHAGES